MPRSSLQQNIIYSNSIACEILVKRVDTFGVVLYRNQRPVNFTLHYSKLQIGSSIKCKTTLFGNYFLQCNKVKIVYYHSIVFVF